jgi:DUF2934 family protein
MERMSEPKPRRKRQSKPAKPVQSAKLNEQQMRDAAYFLWEQEGRPDGRALDHWLQVAGQRGDNLTAR